jgi:hypothetical protein
MPMRTIVLTVVAIAGCGLVAPSSVRADCGQPYHAPAHGSGDASIAHFDQLARTGALADGFQPAHKEPPIRCGGGSCSRAPVLPISHAPVPSARAEHWLCLPADSAHPGTKPAWLIAAHRRLAPSPQPPSLFRPPRVVGE